MAEIDIICLTSDKRTWLLPGFARQWARYAPGLTPLTFAGFSFPDAIRDQVPAKVFEYLSLGNFADYPVNKWSDALLKVINETPAEFMLLLLEDYWLTREVDMTAVNLAADIMRRDPGIIRFDLTSDRLYSGNIIKEVGSVGHLDIIESGPSDYQFSFQAGIWRKSLLSQVLKPGESPWESELNGNFRLVNNFTAYKVYGFRQWPLKYQVMVRNGAFVKGGDWMFPPRQVNNEDMQELDRIGYMRM